MASKDFRCRSVTGNG